MRQIELLLATTAALIAIQPVTAVAQEAPTPPAAEPETPVEGEIVVSGTRIQSSGFTAPTPTTVIGEALLDARGITNAVDAINEVPAFRPSQTPAAAGRGGTSSGGSFVDLRGLSAVAGAPTARTLVLVDGRRFVPSNQIGQVDLNLVPASLIQRVEVVTGGASAAWGSDAVAGVVNVILKDKLEGFEGGASYGVSDVGDFKEYAANLAAGGSFADGRGHVILGIDYLNNRGVGDGYVTRDWNRLAYGNLVLPANRPAGTASRNILPDIRISDRMAPGGVIVGGPLDNIEFTGGQGTRTFTPGTLVGGTQMLGGGANNSNAGVYFAGGSNLINPIRRWATMGRLSFDVADWVQLFVEANHGESVFTGLSASHRDDANLTIRRDNAFLPESVRQAMINNNLQTITVGRVALDDNFSYYRLRTDQQVDRVVVGASGAIGSKWKWDAYYQFGRSNYVQRNDGVEAANYLAAIDAVRDGSGNIVCRGGAANNPDPGCVPFNIFGMNSPSQAAVDYVRRTMVNNVTTKQTVIAANISGEPIDLWAGPLSVAFGVEYRKEEVSSQVDADSLARRYDVSNYQPIQGSYDTREVYFEAALPVLRESVVGHSLDLNGAVRRTDYSTSGVVTTWKVGGSYEPVADLRLRATLSRDIRAPNLNEYFARAITARALINDPVTGVSVQANGIVSGNPNLRPERADTFTAGGVFQPRFIPGLRASVDYYHITIKDVITQLASQVIVDRCIAGVADLCPLITRNAANAITEVRGQSLNFNSLETAGVDFELQYAVPADAVVPGRVTLRGLATYVDRLVLTDTGGPVDRVRQTVPHWSANLSLDYALGRFGALAQVRIIGDTLFDSTLIGPDGPGYSPTLSNSINLNRRSPVAYVNLSAKYELMSDGPRKFEIFGVVNNLFDKDPPPFAGNNPVGGVLYDLVGRAYRVGFRFKY